MQDAKIKVKTTDPAAYQRWRYAEGAGRRKSRLAAIRVARYLTTGELPTIEAIGVAIGVDSRRVLDMAGCRKVNPRFAEYAHAPVEALEGRDALINWYQSDKIVSC